MGLGIQQDIPAECFRGGYYQFQNRVFHPVKCIIRDFFRAHRDFARHMGGFKEEYNDRPYDFYVGHDFHINSEFCFDFLYFAALCL